MHFQAQSSADSFGALRVKSYSLPSQSHNQVQSLNAKQGPQWFVCDTTAF